MKVLLVGDKPSPRMKPLAKPFEGARCHGRVLEWIQILGINEPKLYNRVDYALQHMIKIGAFKHIPVVAFGTNPSKFLTKYGIAHFKLPHPSGLNRQINDKAFIVSKLDECKKYIENYNK